MSKKIQVVKSPLHKGIEKISAHSSYNTQTISITLPNGTMITNPEQFEDLEIITIEVFNEETSI